MSEKVTIPTALEGVDLTRFTSKELVIDPNKSFEQNLNDLFGITPEKAAEIVATAVAIKAPVSSNPAPIEVSGRGGKRRKMKGGIGVVFAAIGAIASSLFGATSHAASGIATLDAAAAVVNPTTELAKSAEAWREIVGATCAKVATVSPSPTFAAQSSSGPISSSGTSTGIVSAPLSSPYKAFQREVCNVAIRSYEQSVDELTHNPELWVQVKSGESAAMERGQGLLRVVNVAGIVSGEIATLEEEGVLNEGGRVVNMDAFLAAATRTANSMYESTLRPDAPESAMYKVTGGKRRAKKTLRVSKRRNTRRRRT